MSMTAGTHPTPGQAARRAWAWLAVHEKTRWTLFFLTVCTACYIANTGIAWAAPGDGEGQSFWGIPLGDLSDSDGVPIYRYGDVPMDPGNGVAYIDRTIQSTVAGWLWNLYFIPLVASMALIEWILDFEWLSWIAAPFETLAGGLAGVLDSWMLVTLGVGVASVVIAFGFLRGRKGAATVEAIMAIVVFGVIASPVADPFDWLVKDEGSSVAGEGGFIQQSAETGAAAGGLTVHQDAEADDVGVTSSIVDVTLRNTMLSMAFGSPLEGECAATWNEEAKDAGNTAEDIRKEVIDCSDEVAAANQEGGGNWFGHYLMGFPMAAGAMALFWVFLAFLLKEVVMLFIGALAVVIRSYLALFPGGGRTAWLSSLFRVLVCVVMIGLYVWALNVYMWLFDWIVGAVPADLLQLGMMVAALIILILVVTFWMMKKSGKKVGDKLAKALGKNGMDSNAPERKPSNFGTTAGNLAKGAARTYQRSRTTKALTNAGLAASSFATGGTTGAAAKVGTKMATKAATTRSMVAASKMARTGRGGPVSSAAPGPKQLSAGSGTSPASGDAGSPGGGGPGGAPQEPDAPAGPSSPLQGNIVPAPEGADAAPSTQLATRQPAEVPVSRTAMPTRSTDRQAQPNSPSGAPQKMSRGRGADGIRHLKPGNYGGTWVHKNGQAHRPRPSTITPDGTPAPGVPREDKIRRATQTGEAWILSPGVQPPRSQRDGQDTSSGTPGHPDSSAPSPRRGMAPTQPMADVQRPRAEQRPQARQENTAPAGPVDTSPAKSAPPAMRPSTERPPEKPAASDRSQQPAKDAGQRPHQTGKTQPSAARQQAQAQMKPAPPQSEKQPGPSPEAPSEGTGQQAEQKPAPRRMQSRQTNLRPREEGER